MPVSLGFGYDRFIVFGGSSTEFAYDTKQGGWVAQIANKYKGKIDVINRGFSGYNTRYAKEIFFKLFPRTECISTKDNANKKITQHLQTLPSNDNDSELSRFLNKSFSSECESKIRLVTIFLGVNDASLPWNALHIPLPEFIENLSQMIELIHNPSSAYYNKNIKIILITPPPVHEEMWKIECAKSNLPMNRSNELAKLYADAVVEVGKKYKVPVVNIYDRIIAEIQNYRASHFKSEASEGNSVQQGSGDDIEKGRWFGFEQFLYDGLHLNGRGNTILTEMILDTIATHFPELHHRKLKPVVPTIYEAIEFYDKLSKMHIKSKL